MQLPFASAVALLLVVLLASVLLVHTRSQKNEAHANASQDLQPRQERRRQNTRPHTSPPHVRQRAATGVTTEPRVRRRGHELSAADEVGIAAYSESLARAASGEAVNNLPDVVRLSMHLPAAARPDFRQRHCQPFERSYFRAQIAALNCKSGETSWWKWLAGDGTAREMFDCIVEDVLVKATHEERSYCTGLLNTWLLQRDDFKALRTALAEFEENGALTLPEIQTRETDAYEREFSKDGLLVCILGTLLPALREEGILAERSSPRCPACFRSYSRTAPTHVTLVCFLPCSHWLCHDCFKADSLWKETEHGRAACCAECNVEAMPLVRDWPGAMV